MTKEELKQEAEEWLSKNWTPYDFYDTECNVYNDDIKEDLIKAYHAGAEPREKQIAELEATCNKWFEHLKNREEELLNELNNQNAKYNKQIAELEKDKQYFSDSLDKQIEATYRLDKENAELKGLVNQYKASKCSGISLANRNMIMSVQLTKAKEIIKEFVEWANWQGNSKCPSFKSIQDKAEQFLSEVEK